MNQLNYKHLNDEQIIEIIINTGENKLYEVIHSRYFPKVTDKCYSFFKDKYKSEEFANDILSRAYEKLGTFKGKSSFSSWLFSLSYNYIIDHLRKKKQLHYPNWNLENELPEIIEEVDADMTELSYERLMDIFEKIHPEEKAILLMKYQDELSLKDIAKSLFISEDAVKMRLKRARSRVSFLYYKIYGVD